MILLDTHALIWWAAGNHLRLSANALAAIDQEIESAGRPGGSPGLLVSAISCWEVAILVNRGRLALSLDVERWLALLASHPAVRLLGLDPSRGCGRHLPTGAIPRRSRRSLPGGPGPLGGDSPAQRRQPDPLLRPCPQPLVKSAAPSPETALALLA